MTYKEIKDTYQDINQLLLDGKVNSAIEKIDLFANQSDKIHIEFQLQKQKDIYHNILKHSFIGIQDPQRDRIFDYLIRSLIEINDSIKEKLLTETSSLKTYKLKWAVDKKRQIQSEENLSMVRNLTLDRELHQILKENNIHLDQEESDNLVSRQDSLNKIFNYLWLVDDYQEAEIKLVDIICNSEKVPWHDKALIVSAITLGLLRNFDKHKFMLLTRFYLRTEHQIWQRALIGIMLATYKYNNRLHLYTEITDQIEKIKEDPDYTKNIEAISIQLIKTKETEELTKKWETEILPEVMKMQSKIEKKLDIENIVSDKFLEDKNPDWEVVFEDSPDLLDKLQEFSQLQIEGSDVFMSAFSRLKHFPFFQSIGNWFVPFYKENEVFQDDFSDDQSIIPLIEKLEQSHFMCNSDKYSFCLNMQYIPETHKSQMMQMFNSEMESLAELSDEDSLLDEFSKTKSIYTQYLQDIYRFFKLYPQKEEFHDIFIDKLDLYNTILLDPKEQYKSTIRNIAEYLFTKNRFDQAIDIFKHFETSEEVNLEMYEKIGYCFQRMGDYQNALDYYLKAELFDTNKAWLNKKIALCYRYLENHEKALFHYQEAEKLEPENLYIQAYIGHSLLSMQKYEDALKYYFKVEYLAPSNNKVQRPISWISFLLGKFDTAKNYLNKLIDSEKNRLDILNLGHVYWCEGKIKEAIDKYKESLLMFDDNFEQFRNSFEDESKILQQHNITKRNIDLMLDFLNSRI